MYNIVMEEYSESGILQLKEEFTFDLNMQLSKRYA